MNYKKNKGLGKVNYPEGCGWWCRRGMDLLSVAGNVLTGNYIGAVSYIINASSKISLKDVKLTLWEEEIVEPWHESQFLPFLKEITAKTDKYFTLNTYSKENLIEINEVLQQIELVIATKKLDPQNSAIRKVLADAIQEYIEKVLSAVQINCKSYMARVKPTITTKTVEFNFTVLQPVVIDEYTGTYKVVLFYDKELASDITDIIPIDPIDPKGNNGTGTGTGTGTDTGNTNATLGNKSYISWIVGAIVAYRIFK